MTAPSQMNTARSDSASIGQLIDNISEDLSRLLRGGGPGGEGGGGARGPPAPPDVNKLHT